jgi:hypothetical protein
MASSTASSVVARPIDAMAADVVPDFAVTRIRLLEEAGSRSGRRTGQSSGRDDALQFGERVTLEVHAPRIFGRQVRFDADGFVEPFQRLFRAFRERAQPASDTSWLPGSDPAATAMTTVAVQAGTDGACGQRRRRPAAATSRQI